MGATRVKVGVVVYDPSCRDFYVGGGNALPKVFANKAASIPSLREHKKQVGMSYNTDEFREWLSQLIFVPVFAKVPNARQSD